ARGSAATPVAPFCPQAACTHPARTRRHRRQARRELCDLHHVAPSPHGGRATFKRLLAIALLAAGCSDAVTPPSRSAGTPGLLADVTASGLALWGHNGTMPQSGAELSKEFNPENPPLGSTV